MNSLLNWTIDEERTSEQREREREERAMLTFE